MQHVLCNYEREDLSFRRGGQICLVAGPDLTHGPLLAYHCSKSYSCDTLVSDLLISPSMSPSLVSATLLSVRAPVNPPEEERSTIKTITTTLLLMGLMDKASDHSYTPHDPYCLWSVQVVYHSVLTDDNGLLRWMD